MSYKSPEVTGTTETRLLPSGTEMGAIVGSKPASTTSREVVQWGVGLRTPSLTIVCFLCGIALAVGHHVYYQSLDGTPVASISQQEWLTRVGLGLAFLTKVALAAAMTIAIEQHLWMAVNQKSFRLETLDAIFSLAHTPLSFFNAELLLKAKVLAVLCLLLWTVPLIAVVTPSTLSVHLLPVQSHSPGIVPTVNFTLTDPSLWSDYIGVGWPMNASPLVSRLLTAVASSMQIASIPVPGVNSTYALQFYGPAIRCQMLADAKSNNYPFSASSNSSLEDYWNTAFNNTQTFRTWWESVTPGGYPLESNLIFVRTGDEGDASQSKQPLKNISCQHWNSSYNVQIANENGVQRVEIMNLAHIAPFNVSWYTIAVPIDSTDTATTPNSVLPPQGRPYISMQLAFSRLLAGKVFSSPGLSSNGLPGGDLPIVNTGLFTCPEILLAQNAWGPFQPNLTLSVAPWMCRNGSIEKAIEDLSHNFTISLMSNYLLSGQSTSNITFTNQQNYWTYNPEDLLAAYGAGIAATVLCLIFGAYASWKNGYSAGATFSSIMFTTRNIDLDDLSGGHCIGAKPLPEDVGKVGLRFGIVNGTGTGYEGVGHAAFGTVGTIRPLRRGEVCA